MEYRVEELAISAALSVDTIRYYQKIGLLEPPARRGRVGIYGESHRSRLDEIASLSDQGFSLAQISRLSNHPDDRLLEALRGDSGGVLIDRDELIIRAKIDDDLVELAIDAGLIRPHATSPERFGADATEMLEAAATILDSGLPLEDLIAVAVDHASHVEDVVDTAIDLFIRNLPADTDAADAVASLVPAVSKLVAQHFRHTLVDRAAARLQSDRSK